MPTRKVSLEKNLDMKYVKVHVLKNVARVTKRGSDIQTDQIGSRPSFSRGHQTATIMNYCCYFLIISCV